MRDFWPYEETERAFYDDTPVAFCSECSDPWATAVCLRCENPMCQTCAQAQDDLCVSCQIARGVESLTISQHAMLEEMGL
jgi:hypothetical protein